MCAWCKHPTDDVDPQSLCLRHAAEYEGLTVDEMDRRDRVQYAEWLDTGHYHYVPGRR